VRRNIEKIQTPWLVFNCLLSVSVRICVGQYTHARAHTRTHTRDVSTHRSWDEKQRERARLSRLAMLERDNHHTDNTHMMKVQNLAEDEIVGGGCLFAIYIQVLSKYKQLHAFLRACYILYVVRTCAIHKYVQTLTAYCIHTKISQIHKCSTRDKKRQSSVEFHKCMSVLEGIH
jgi:hypothetical protein